MSVSAPEYVPQMCVELHEIRRMFMPVLRHISIYGVSDECRCGHISLASKIVNEGLKVFTCVQRQPSRRRPVVGVVRFFMSHFSLCWFSDLCPHDDILLIQKNRTCWKFVNRPLVLIVNNCSQQVLFVTNSSFLEILGCNRGNP